MHNMADLQIESVDVNKTFGVLVEDVHKTAWLALLLLENIEQCFSKCGIDP